MTDKRLVLIEDPEPDMRTAQVLREALERQYADAPAYSEAVEKIAKALRTGDWDQLSENQRVYWRIQARRSLAALGWPEEETT